MFDVLTTIATYDIFQSSPTRFFNKPDPVPYCYHVFENNAWKLKDTVTGDILSTDMETKSDFDKENFKRKVKSKRKCEEELID